MPKKKAPRRSATAPRTTPPNAQRLNKVLAAAGLGSRRKVEELIADGRVQIDGQVVTDLASKVDPATVKIKVDGELLKKPRLVYFALNKPPGVLSTNADPSGRMRVIDLVPDTQRVFSVGRLDQSSEGLMLLTNDGELAQRLAHPRFRIQKTYFVVVSGQMSEDELAKLRKGVYLAEGVARIDGAAIKRVRKGCTELEIVLSEGKNREIRRILARAGHKVVLLRRIAIGPLRLGTLPVGASRLLSPTEVKALHAAAVARAQPGKSAGKSTGKVASKSTGKPAGKATASHHPPGKRLAAPSPTAVEPEINAYDEDGDDDLLSLASSGQWAEDSDEDISWDDDFVGDFSGSGQSGSVLAFDEPATQPSEAAPRPRRTPRSRTAAGRNSSSRSSSKRSASGRSASGPSSTGRGSAERKATGRSSKKAPARNAPPRNAPARGGPNRKPGKRGKR